MSKRHNFPDSNRRNFLKGAGLVSAAALTPLAASAQVPAPKQNLKASVPSPTQFAVETLPPSKDPVNQTSSGGDFMVDVLNLNFDYLTMTALRRSAASMSPLSITARIPSPKSSPVHMKRSLSTWRRATPRWKANRWR